MKSALRMSAAALLALCCAAPARAAAVVAVLSADHGVYRRAFDGFEAAYGSTVPLRLATRDGALDPDTRVVVAIGGRAALRAYPSDVAVVYCLAPAVDIGLRNGPTTRVRLVPRPDVLLARVKAAQPKARALAVLWSQAFYDGYAAQLLDAGRRASLQVISMPVDSADLPRGLRLLQGRADALWLAPDPLLVTPANFKMISAFARKTHVAFYAPLAELVREGATAAITVTPEEMGRAAAGVVRQGLHSGKGWPREVFGDRVEVVVDPARAREAGVSFSTDAVKLR